MLPSRHLDLETPMSLLEQTPLLNVDGNWRTPPRRSSSLTLKAEGEPSWLDSYRWFIFGSWLNVLLLLVPVAAAAHYLDWDAPLRFGFSFAAIIPLAKVRTRLGSNVPDFQLIVLNVSAVAWRCYRRGVPVPRANSCQPLERYFRERG